MTKTSTGVLCSSGCLTPEGVQIGYPILTPILDPPESISRDGPGCVTRDNPIWPKGPSKGDIYSVDILRTGLADMARPRK